MDIGAASRCVWVIGFWGTYVCVLRVFLPQAYAELFNHMGYDVLETHSRKSQAYRTRVSEAFRNRKGVILFSSDVSARGLDYPDVTLVVQVIIPT